MKLKTYLPTDFKTSLRSKPTIHLASKSGTVTFSKGAVSVLGLSEEKRNVLILQDEDHPQDWYLRVLPAGSTEGFNLRNKSDQNMMFNSCGLVNKIFTDCKHSKPSGTVLIGAYDNEADVYPLITSSLKVSL